MNAVISMSGRVIDSLQVSPISSCWKMKVNLLSFILFTTQDIFRGWTQQVKTGISWSKEVLSLPGTCLYILALHISFMGLPRINIPMNSKPNRKCSLLYWMCLCFWYINKLYHTRVGNIEVAEFLLMTISSPKCIFKSMKNSWDDVYWTKNLNVVVFLEKECE